MSSIGVFSGLTSGIDFRSLVDQIMQVESQPLRRLEGELADIGARSSAYNELKSLVDTFEGAADRLRQGSAFDTRNTSVRHSGSLTPLSASASSGAAVGTYDLRVLSLATREKLSGEDFPSRSEGLGLSGSFVMNGVTVNVDGDDALSDIVGRINEAFLGTSDGKVSASILSPSTDRHRVVLSAADHGADGIDLVDPDGILTSLGLLDGGTVLKHTTTDGYTSDAFTSADLAVGDLLGLTVPPDSASVTIGTLAVEIDLSLHSLNDIAGFINAAAAAAQPVPSDISAQVVSETGADGIERFRLDVSGTTVQGDSNRILQTLGVLEGTRSAVAQVLTSGSPLQQAGGSTPATGATEMTDLAVGSSGAGVSVGDTIDFAWTMGDGSAGSFTYALTDGSLGQDTTLNGLLAELENAMNASAADGRTVSVSLEPDGAVKVTDSVTGDSRLTLTAVANNEGGGTLDLAGFAITESGRAREVVRGADAEIEVDGVHMTRSDNTFSDAIDGVELRLSNAAPDVTATVEVSPSYSGVTSEMESLVGAYNKLNDFVKSQTGTDAPLAGSVALRGLVRSIRSAMQSTLGGGVTGGITRLGEIGVTIQSDGSFELDKALFSEAVESNPTAVRRVLGVYGSPSVSSLEYVASSDATSTGTYEVFITQEARQAQVTGSGFSVNFGGVYADDGVDDIMTVHDRLSGGSYRVSLADGMTLTQIVNALNTEFETAEERVLTAAAAMTSDDTGATPVTLTTALAELRDAAGTSLGVATDDTFTLSGRKADGTSFSADFTVTDASAQTLGDLVSTLEAQFEGDAEVTVNGSGRLVITATETGSALMEATISSDDAAGGTFGSASFEVTTAGRSVADLTASDASGELRITSGAYGSAAGLEISYTAGGADGTAALGLAAGEHTGTDIAGTLGGATATGAGRLLTGAEGTAAEGLQLRYTGADTGSIGELVFSRGIASLMELAAEALLGTDDGSIASLIDVNEGRIASVERRIDTWEARLERKEQTLLDRFIAMEQAIARSQQTTTALLTSIGAGVDYSGSSNT